VGDKRRSSLDRQDSFPGLSGRSYDGAVRRWPLRRRRPAAIAPTDRLAGLSAGRWAARPLELGGMAVAHRSFGVIVAGAGPVDVVDVVETAHGLRAVIGTVEAADTAARPVAAALVTAFRSCADEAAVEDVAAALDAAVSGMGGEAVSAAVLVVGVGAQGDATVVNCGHPEPLLLFAGGGAIPLRTTRGTAPLAAVPDRPGTTTTCSGGKRSSASPPG
jgi:hypothetical protein